MNLSLKALTSHREREHKSHKLRWFILIATAAFAVAWRTQTAISRAPQRVKAALGGPDGTGYGGAATQERPPAQRAAGARPMGGPAATRQSALTETAEHPERLTGGRGAGAPAAENPASAAEGDTASARAELAAQPAESAAPAAAAPAGDATAPTPPKTEPAGKDASGAFRPTKTEPDDFGVVVTDDEPSGLAGSANWVEGLADGSCPDDHPIKGNASSRIYHLPGSSSYNQTHAELCFASEDGATAAGYRPRAHR